MSPCTKTWRGSSLTDARLSGLPAYVSLSRLTMRQLRDWRVDVTKLDPMNPAPPVTSNVSRCIHEHDTLQQTPGKEPNCAAVSQPVTHGQCGMDPGMLRALVLVNKAPGVSPGQRFRIEQWEPHLRKEHGIDVEYRPFESPALTRVLYQNGKATEKAVLLLRDTVRRRSIVGSVRGYDAVIIYREAALMGPPVYEWLISRSGVPILYDFDDAIWTAPRRAMVSTNDAFRALKFAGKTATICRLANAVTVGNEYLASWARKHNAQVQVVPTSIELAAYPVQPPLPTEEPFTIVWSGTFSTLEHLELARVPLERLAKRRAVRLNVICDRPLSRPIAGVDTRFIAWRADAEARTIGTGHVGIMPLPDEEFTRGKCGCKALQYMAAGRVAVASPVGVNSDIIRHGESGFLASSEDEWTDILEQLASSKSLRDRVASVGRKTVEERFSAERSAALFAKAIRVAVGGVRKASSAAAAGAL
jgi:glycosyltransferase involved in cell wall biosynthesis